MRRPDFAQFEAEMLREGIAPRQVRRTVCELREHLDDLVEAELLKGSDAASAQSVANQEIGDLRDVLNAVRACPELRSWAHRFPRIAIVVYPLACVALLPAIPIYAGVAHASQIVRWATCMLLGGIVTAAMFLALQMSIALN